MKLYHGTISTGADNIIKNGIILEKGKKKVDFGQGFYTTNSFEFAKSTAVNKAKKTNSYNNCKCIVYPTVLTYDFDTDLAKNMNVLQFQNTNIEWAQFIINNRNGIEYMKSAETYFHNLYKKYDIVKGAIADNSIVLLSQMLKLSGKRVKREDIKSMLYSYLTCQISFHTERSIGCIELKACDIIKPNKEKGDVINE